VTAPQKIILWKCLCEDSGGRFPTKLETDSGEELLAEVHLVARAGRAGVARAAGVAWRAALHATGVAAEERRQAALVAHAARLARATARGADMVVRAA
jgi:hypothetical protein